MSVAGKVVRFPEPPADPGDGNALKSRIWVGTASNQRSHTHYGRDIATRAWFYFVHSYYVAPSDPSMIAGRTDYGVTFTSAIASDNVFATQFHPEKSQRAGLQLLANYLSWDTG